MCVHAHMSVCVHACVSAAAVYEQVDAFIAVCVCVCGGGGGTV